MSCLFCIRSGFSQGYDSLTTVRGYVMDSETLADLSGVHVFNTQGRITVTDVKGFFSLRIKAGDTLTFSRIDYEKKRLIVKNTESPSLVVTLRQRVYILDTVDIIGEYAIPPYLLRHEGKPVYIEGITRNIDTEKDYRLGVGGSLASPVTALYQLFSKRYKEEKKYHELKVEEKSENELLEKVYLRLDEILELNDIKLYREEYDLIIGHCRLNLEWVVASNNYDLYMRMEKCLEDYLMKR